MNKWLVTASVMIPTMIEILDTSVANVSLTHIQGSLSAGQEEVTWVLTLYLVANAVVIPMSAWLARVMGRKRYLLASLIVFTVSSMLCGAAVSLEQLILFRVIQGIGGGGLQPMSQAILMESFPPSQRGLAMGIFGVGERSWGRFWAPLSADMSRTTIRGAGSSTSTYPWGSSGLHDRKLHIRPLVPANPGRGRRGGLCRDSASVPRVGKPPDIARQGANGTGSASNLIRTLSCVAGVSLVGLVFRELRQKRPILDLRIFRDRSFATGCSVMFMAFFAFFGSIGPLPLYLQTLMGTLRSSPV